MTAPLVLGTAGHIDHGKTTLVAALTGIDTDRLAEEKRRGISIELGFAHLTLPSGRRASLIDVPGHERFVKNMLAGVTGIDLVLLIVAADESVKPQTIEHFEICRLLGIQRGIVVITKSDLADPDLLALVELETAELVRGSFLENAPVVPVSARSGQGLPELRAAIDQLAARLGPRQSTRHPRLPIDRCFTLKGHGTVVTGTLRDAPLRTDTELAVYPTSRLTRVRSLQTHNSSAPQAEPGARVAINLTGLEVSELARGQVLAPPHVYRSTRLLDAQIEILASSKPIKDRAPVHFHSAAMETEAELRLLSREKSLAPGGQAFVRLALREEHLLLPGDRFILRSFSPVHTIAGGTVLDIHFSPQRLKRLGQADRLAAWSKLSVAERSRLLVEAESLGIAQPEVCLRLAASPADLDPGLLQTPDHWLIAPARLAALDQSLAARLARHHHEKPLEPGLSRESLRSELLAAAPPSLLDLILSQSQSLAAHGEFLRLKSHRVQMAAPEDAAAKKIEAAFRDAGLAVPNLEDVLKATALPAPQSKAVLSHLLRGGQLVRVSPELVFHRDAISQLKSLLAPKKGHRFSVADFKDWTGISRKYAIPLLEFLDREKSTRRDGDQRIVL